MISYYTRGTDFGLKFKTKINKWIKTISNNHGFRRLSLNYIFCSDEELLKINREFLNHDFYTDIITFDTLDDQVIKKSALSGDIFISIDTVHRNSHYYNVSFDTELRRVMIHGVLHLMGFDDLTPEQQIQMHNQEDSALDIYVSENL